MLWSQQEPQLQRLAAASLAAAPWYPPAEACARPEHGQLTCLSNCNCKQSPCVCRQDTQSADSAGGCANIGLVLSARNNTKHHIRTNQRRVGAQHCCIGMLRERCERQAVHPTCCSFRPELLSLRVLISVSRNAHEPLVLLSSRQQQKVCLSSTISSHLVEMRAHMLDGALLIALHYTLTSTLAPIIQPGPPNQ